MDDSLLKGSLCKMQQSGVDIYVKYGGNIIRNINQVCVIFQVYIQIL
jgi:hypothetical protein